MNIESARFKITSGAGGGFDLLRKSDGATAHLTRAPSAHSLAMMQESQFNREAADAMHAGEWS